MPDRIVSLGRERSVRTLAQRLFVIEGPDAAAKLRHAEKALLRANPELGKAEGFSSGRPVVVPGDIGLDISEPVERTTAGASGLLDESGVRLELAGKALAERFDAAGRASAERIKQMDDRDFTQKVRKALPASAAILSQTQEELGKRAEEDKTRAKRFGAAIEEAQERLAALRALAERR